MSTPPRLVAQVIVFLLCATALPQSFARAMPPDLAKAIEQFRAFYLGYSHAGQAPPNGVNERVASPSEASKYAGTLRADGAWPDLDYHSTAVGYWPPATHCSRLLAMVSAAANAGIGASDRSVLLTASHRAFAFWTKTDPHCRNWWYNNIGVPQILATAALLMGNELTRDERAYLNDKVMPRCKIGMTGQNRVWLSANTLMLALLREDAPVVEQASATIWDEIRISESEGIQPDFSFHQHGPQQQFGNYGLAFAVEEVKWAQILRGTPWAMPQAKLDIYRKFLLDGENWASYRGSMDISSCGRQLGLDSPKQKTSTISRVMQSAAVFDPSFATDYLAFVKRNTSSASPNDLLGDRLFWRSDYLVHRRPDWCATLKMHSARTIGSESINGENLLGYYLSDGALYLYRNGDEYQNIFPVWDWCKLPGVTCPQSADGPPRLTPASLKTDRTFVGGVGDGTFACAAFDYDRDGVKAKKAWFFADDTILCLGAGIESSNPSPVATTINQSLLRGNVLVKIAGKDAQAISGPHQLDQVEWVEHDGWRYTFPHAATVNLDTSTRTGNWNRVFKNPSTPSGDVTKALFTLWLDHGPTPAAADYAYAISPAGQSPNARVLENAVAAQAVAFDDHRTGILFLKPGKLKPEGNREIEAQQPCAVLVDWSKKTAMVSDPTQRLASLSIRINGKLQEVSLPIGGDAGKSVPVRFD